MTRFVPIEEFVPVTGFSNTSVDLDGHDTTKFANDTTKEQGRTSKLRGFSARGALGNLTLGIDRRTGYGVLATIAAFGLTAAVAVELSEGSAIKRVGVVGRTADGQIFEGDITLELPNGAYDTIREVSQMNAATAFLPEGTSVIGIINGGPPKPNEQPRENFQTVTVHGTNPIPVTVHVPAGR